MAGEDAITHRIEAGGIVRVTLNSPGARVNLLTSETMRTLDEILIALARRDDVRGLLFESAKPGMFIAGADVEEIAAIDDAYRAAEAARFGQAVFQKIADLRIPSACSITGPCLGGGTELALACTFRVAADTPEVRIGLPEVQIGIIPGFGGTQRLPHLVGLTRALDLVLSGRTVSARTARKMGLVDLVVPTPLLEREALALLERAAADPRGTLRRVRKPRGAMTTFLEGLAPWRRFVLSRARKSTEGRVRESDYPAPFRALAAVDAAFALPLHQGLDLEARIVGELIPTRTSKNLIRLFKSQTALKREPDNAVASPRRVRRIAILGAGIMGGGIAQLAADRGIPVRLKDVRQDALLTALRTASGLWRKQIAKGRLDRVEFARRMALVSTTLDERGFSRIDLVVEAVVEDLAVKQKVLAAVEERIGERTVFASNTSSLPIGEIAARALRPERVVGLHFFNPVHRMPLVEVIAGPRSSPEAVATVRAFAVELGKTPVVVRDSPGFLVNRILMLYLGEAMHLLAEGMRIEQVDAAATAFGMPMGPFALLDQVGLDTARHVAGVLEGAFGKRIGAATPVLGALVESGRLGMKTDGGFYKYAAGKRRSVDPKVYSAAKVDRVRELPMETLQERMILAMVNEAAVCLEDGVASEARDIDVAMVLGAGFPPFRGGLLRHADETGIPLVVDRLSRLADAQGERFRPAELLREMAREQRHFYP